MDVMRHCSSFLLPATSTAADSDGVGGTAAPPPAYALVLLNQRLPRFAPLLWQHAQVRMCADGGANRVYDEMPDLFPDEDASAIRNRYKPEAIRGDMDSIRPEVMDFYRTLLCILVAGALGGRFDHEIGNINVLCRFSDTRIILISDDCLIQLLPRTHRHEIHILSSVEGPHCGLIPIGMPSKSTTTTGLKWDLADTEMKFGGLISTSNIAKEETVTVRSDSDLLWTISIKKPGFASQHEVHKKSI
ncbi:thiamine pyrophosphokinase 1 isoform X2 [Eucalyptus grandis]|uniref:thiamine pyrophosphokinase 1 isoform X2 n=1 Tax=Eucalyptus grandis TaxID=71139 RepID=UPI00192EE416|nr:thiamine pyrophosphokinase 1 isoform X2 [Eucalyptus grandis]